MSARTWAVTGGAGLLLMAALAGAFLGELLLAIWLLTRARHFEVTP